MTMLFGRQLVFKILKHLPHPEVWKDMMKIAVNQIKVFHDFLG